MWHIKRVSKVKEEYQDFWFAIKLEGRLAWSFELIKTNGIHLFSHQNGQLIKYIPPILSSSQFFIEFFSFAYFIHFHCSF